MKYTYMDFLTRKKRYTRGQFVRWERGGVLNAYGAIFKTRMTIIFVPYYLLTSETIAKLPPVPIE